MDNEDSAKGAFSIQNICKMGFANGKFPGEWYGPHAISLMLRVSIHLFLNYIQDLNKLFCPVKNFEICIFNDGAIYYDKIMKLACKTRNDVFVRKSYPNRPERDTLHSNIEFIFKK